MARSMLTWHSQARGILPLPTQTTRACSGRRTLDMHSSKVHPAAADEENSLQQQLHRPPRVCFSFAAYAKGVVSQLRESGATVVEGVSDEEFSAIESSLSFCFPPDLQAILREGLPIGPGFPNWRSASRDKLQTLIHLPVAEILSEVSVGRLWCDSAWGPKPRGAAEALAVAKSVMEAAPPLVPVYQKFYLPSRPSMAGNPVFFVCRGEVRRSNVDLTDFFQREEFVGETWRRTAAAWASTSPRPIDVWTQLADGMKFSVAGPPLQELLEQQEWKLREGGWTKREAKEMLSECVSEEQSSVEDYGLPGRVRSLELALLKAGWSQEDVAYSMGDAGVLPNANRRNDGSMDQ